MSEKEKHIENLDVINRLKPVVINLPGMEPVTPPVVEQPTESPADASDTLELPEETTEEPSDELDEVVPTTVDDDDYDSNMEPQGDDVLGDDPDEPEGEDDVPEATDMGDSEPAVDNPPVDEEVVDEDVTNTQPISKEELLTSLGFVQEVSQEKETLRVEELKQEDESKSGTDKAFREDGTPEFTTVKLPSPLLQKAFDEWGLIMDTNGRSMDNGTATNQMLVVYILARLVGLRLKDVPELMGYSTMQTDKWNGLCDVMRDIWRQKVFPIETYVQALNQKHMRLLDQQRDSQALIQKELQEMEEHYTLLETAVIMLIGKSVGTGAHAKDWVDTGTPILHGAKRYLEQRKKTE